MRRFDLPSFTLAAFADLKVNVALLSVLHIEEFVTDLVYSQAEVPAHVDDTLLVRRWAARLTRFFEPELNFPVQLLLPVLAQPIVQKIVDGSILAISTVLISDPTDACRSLLESFIVSELEATTEPFSRHQNSLYYRTRRYYHERWTFRRNYLVPGGVDGRVERQAPWTDHDAECAPASRTIFFCSSSQLIWCSSLPEGHPRRGRWSYTRRHRRVRRCGPRAFDRLHELPPHGTVVHLGDLRSESRHLSAGNNGRRNHYFEDREYTPRELI